jgi:hypothetical protein
MSTDYRSEIEAELNSLDPDAQRRVLEYVRSLSRTRRSGGRHVAGFAGAIPADDLQLMQAAIESGCEQVDLNEW